MSYLLDTNVVSELRKIGDDKADANVVAWIGAEEAGNFFISAITILELERGVLSIQRRDVAQGARLRAWLDARPDDVSLTARFGRLLDEPLIPSSLRN